ncbi:hypothetical protein [Streptomyces viridochromogenes]|uniref:hypothetical protein n=1 Tax=Streptomyces viridochromogenes TaxID=1938 RepID=UPI00069F49AF|nr:hypothetical protein [Streptomyces viridochromogenes]KOG17097.1 hypothetical protein ADK35_24885 [Streptomyces viridochromogenes]KOG20118.1 hypothetical protein ADK36_17545 [Streptomyces viridochromogenes]
MTATELARQTVPEPRTDRDPGTELRAELVVARAAAAARSGDLDAALRELDRYDDDPAVTRHRDVTDLRARVHAQRGELAEAERCWRQLLDEHPRDESAAAGLARVRRFRRRGPAAALGRARHRLRPAVAVVLCAGAVTAATWGLATRLPSGTGEPRSDSAAVARAAEQDVRQELTEERERAAAEAEDRRTKALDALAQEVRTPGTRVERHEDSVEVVFDQGLFSEAAELTETGAARLALLGERLAGRQQLRVEVLGHIAQVPDAPASGGSVTSLWRAMAAARALSDASGRPLTGFSVASAEQRDAPHDTDAANRTVTVLLTPQTAP